MFHLILLMLLPPFIQTLLGAAKSQRLCYINMLKQNKTKTLICSICCFPYICIYILIWLLIRVSQGEEVQSKLSRIADSLPIHTLSLFFIKVIIFPSDALSTDKRVKWTSMKQSHSYLPSTIPAADYRRLSWLKSHFWKHFALDVLVMEKFSLAFIRNRNDNIHWSLLEFYDCQTHLKF